ncbi:hypothetical protein KGO5_05382 [Sinorhizobium sp. KGO-5]|nr:hypothetical protein KGO5_05382 [Sinorhizobium sp. KGO-5]
MRPVDDPDAPAVQIIAVGALHGARLTEQQVEEAEGFWICWAQELGRLRRRDAFGIPPQTIKGLALKISDV